MLSRRTGRIRLPQDARPTWAEVSLPQIQKNFEALQNRAGKNCEVMAVVKANAYGHGAVPVSRFLAAHGVRWFGVATLEEALELRRAGIKHHLLILGSFFPPQAAQVISNRIQVTASSLAQLNALQRAASRRHPALTHLKFDTGMGRLGFSLEEAEMIAQQWVRGTWNHLRLCGVFSHLASAETPETSQTVSQIGNFSRVLEIFQSAGLEVPVRHLANSAGIAFHPEARFDLARAGIALYGYEPTNSRTPRMGTAPAMALKTRVLHLKSVPRGTPLGYDGTFITPHAAVIATLPIGYADGVDRRLSFANVAPFKRSNSAARPMAVIVNDQFAPIVGRVSMDLTLVDVSQVNGVRVNDEAVLIGASSSHAISADDWARQIGTISYEILCGITSRVCRIYRFD